MTHRIAVIGGDGIGPEVVAEALKVVRATGVAVDTQAFDLGGARYLRDGQILPDATLEELRQRLGASCSAMTLSRALRKLGLPRKKKVPRAAEQDRPDILRCTVRRHRFNGFGRLWI